MQSDYDQLLSISREELDTFTNIHAEFRPKKPLKIAYNDILVRRFDTTVSYNPRLVFDEILTISGRKIDNILSEMDSKIDNAERQFDEWTIHTRFLKISICAHCYTEYDYSDFVFENTANHRVVISFTAHFDASRIYGKDAYNIDAFTTVNNIYSRIQQRFLE